MLLNAYAVHFVQCCTLHIAHCTLHSVHSAMYTLNSVYNADMNIDVAITESGAANVRMLF